MPRPNRVRPTGERFADPARGLLMGNRGCLVDARGQFTRRRWTTEGWVCCRLAFKGRRLPVAPPGRWTALFFLDEATALAAGHRPCGHCRRAELTAYRAAAGAIGRELAALDAALHAARIAAERPRVAPATLPDFAMVAWDDASWLVRGGALRRWTPSGYAESRAAPAEARALTPPLSLAALAGGYRPLIHPSAFTS